MATKGITGYWYKTGTVIKETIVIGPWTELIATVDGVDYQLGTIKKGTILFEARVHKHRTTAKILDSVVPSAVAVEFRGIMEEIHRENVLLLLNRSPVETKPPDGYIQLPRIRYPMQHFTLRGRRPNAVGSNREFVEFCLYKCRMKDLVQLCSGDDTQGIRFRAVALNDVAGNFGGSSAMPYGWFHLDEGPPPQPHPSPPAPYDDDPLENWWWFPDPGVPQNFNQRLETSLNVGLNLSKFTCIAMIRPAVIPSDRQPFMTYYGIDGNNLEPSWAHFQETAGWHARFSNDGASWGGNYLYVHQRGVADKDILTGFNYEFTTPGNNSDGFLYWQQTDTGKWTDAETNLEGPLYGTNYRLQMFGLSYSGVPTRSMYGRVYWFALLDDALLSESDFDDIWSGATKIYDYNPDLYVDFSQEPAAVITPNIDNLGIGDLSVHNWGNIVKGGP